MGPDWMLTATFFSLEIRIQQCDYTEVGCGEKKKNKLGSSDHEATLT